MTARVGPSTEDPGDWVLQLIHQGLLPLSRRTVLAARLVCKHWRSSLSSDITHITVPYDAWGTTSRTGSSSSARLAAASGPGLNQTGWRTAATAAAAALAAVREEVGLEEATEAEAAAARRSRRGQGGNSNARGSKASPSQPPPEPAAAAAVLACGTGQQQEEQPMLHVRTASTSDAPLALAAAETHLKSKDPMSAPAAAGGGDVHPLQLVSGSFPACRYVTLSNRRSVLYDPQAPCGAAAIHQAVALLGQLPKLDSLCVQGYMPAGDWQPLLSALAASNQHPQEQQDAMQIDPAPAAAAMSLPDADAKQYPQQEQGTLQQQQPAVALPTHQPLQQELSLCTRLASLDLQALELPPPMLLESVLAGLPGLRSLTLHASMESIVEAAHLDALASGTQLTSLVLGVYQAAHSRCPLDPLMALTNLQHLEVMYGGIFNDQRPVLCEPLSMSRLVHLTNLASSGLAQPLLPQPNITSLRSLRVAGLTKRLPESAVQLISSCSSPALRELRLEAGRRGIAAVAADQLDHLGFMTQLTNLSLALSKGSLPAGKSTQQLLKLSGLTSLKTLWLGSGDHRLGLSTEHLQQLGQQWPTVNSLRLSGFSPLQGFSGLGSFTGLTALSMKPGVGTGKVLLELQVALQQLSLLRRLHLDFRSALQLDHVEAVSTACASRLQHLSLNMWAPGIGSKALVAIGQLSVLTSLQLMSMRAAVLSGPPGITALREMPQLELLCVQAADEVITEQQPLALGGHLSEVLSGHVGPLREVRIWLGSGVEARQAEAGVAAVVEAELPDCRCKVLKEPEKAIL